MDQAVDTRRTDRLFVKSLCVELAVLDAGDLGTDYCGTALEVLGAVLSPARELPVMGEQPKQMTRPVLGGRRAELRCPRERPIEMVFGLLEIGLRCPEKLFRFRCGIGGSNPFARVKACLQFANPIPAGGD